MTNSDPRALLREVIEQELRECDELGAPAEDAAAFIVDRLADRRDLLVELLGQLDEEDFQATVRDAWRQR